MISSFYTAAGGTIWLQKGLDITANNLANVSTTGYKSDKGSFSDLVTSNVYTKGINDKLKLGNGVKLEKTDTVFTTGSLNQTGRSLDYAIQSDGFFAVRTPSGVKYTRDGSFNLSQQQDGKFYLASADGSGLVLDSKGQPIVAKNEQDKLDVGVYTFGNTDGLSKDGSNYYTATTNSGVATLAVNAELKQGALENSNVDLAQSMTDVITSQRAFQFNTKIVQISDEIMQTINGLR